MGGRGGERPPDAAPGGEGEGLHARPRHPADRHEGQVPQGFVEPEHVHKSWHSILVTKGRMCVAGKDLRPGDYVFGWDRPHGPYEYPDGCEVFAVFIGGGTGHVWDEEKHLRHRTRWKAETAAGKKAVVRGESARERALGGKNTDSRKSAKRPNRGR